MGRQVKQIAVEEPCPRCAGTSVWALPDGDHVRATCANETCGHRRPFIDKRKYGHHWGLLSRPKREVDERFELSIDRREAVFARDLSICAHCGDSLLIDERRGDADPLRANRDPVSCSQLALDGFEPSTEAPRDAPVGPPVRRKSPRTIDHLVQRSITRELERAGAIDALDFKYLSQYWVVTSCLPCNGRRKLDLAGPINEAAVHVHVLALLSLYQAHLVRSHVSDVLDGYDRFLRVLRLVREFLRTGKADRLSA